jgi:heme oxygenase
MTSQETERGAVTLEQASILQRLKEETQTHHHSIEHAIPVMDDALTEAEYVEILKRLYGFYRTFERAIESLPKLQEVVPDLSLRHKLELLKRDLEFYGLEDVDMEALPVPTAAPFKDSEFEALGALYVMEGSSLGGQLISKHLRVHLGLTADTGAAFYNAYGVNTGKMWQAFKNYLKAHVQTETQQDQAVRGAQATFTALQEWIT